jgi:ribonuclease D
MAAAVQWVDSPSRLERVLERARAAREVAFDLESNGLFAYRARVCTVQLGWREGGGELEVAVIDTLALDPARLAPLLATARPPKVAHDLGFDARMLRAAGVHLAGVRDTSVAAQYLGRRATGLAALLHAELGVELDKRWQTSDWARRPLDDASLRYLANDVQHLLDLDERLGAEVEAAGIGAEVRDECAYRLACALLEPVPAPPAFARVRGASRLAEPARSALREVAAVRERAAQRADVPPFRLLADAALLQIAQRRPASVRALGELPAVGRQVSGARAGDSCESFLREIVAAVERGVGRGRLAPEDAAWLDAPAPSPQAIERRRRLERRLTEWRNAEASARGVNAQVVLPGHCLKQLAAGDRTTPEAVAACPGLGETRAARYAPAIAALLEERDRT